jgi:hypothetical protein
MYFQGANKGPKISSKVIQQSQGHGQLPLTLFFLPVLSSFPLTPFSHFVVLFRLGLPDGTFSNQKSQMG